MFFIRTATIASLVLIAGCLPSLHSVYTEQDLVFEPKIAGFWKLENSTQTWDFTKRDDTSYHLVFTDKHGQSGRFIAHVCRVEDTLFLDLFPENENRDSTSFYKYHILPIHTVYMVKLGKTSLELVSIDLNWVKRHLSENPDALAHSTFNSRTLITASTEDLQRFLLKHKDKFTGAFRLLPHSEQAVVRASR